MKFKKLLICLSTPIMASIPLIPLVSCGDSPINPSDDTEDVNVLNRYEISKIYKNKDFTVKLTNPKQHYYKLSKTETQVTIGNKVVTPVWSSDCKSFKVNGTDVKSDEIHISLVAEGTYNTIDWEWKEEETKFGHVHVYHPGQKIKLTTSKDNDNDIRAWVLYGEEDPAKEYDGWKLLKPGDSNFKIIKDVAATGESKDITSTFGTTGYTFTEDDLSDRASGGKNATQQLFWLKYSDEFGSRDVSTVDCYCALPIEEFSVTPAESTIKTTEESQHKVAVNQGAWKQFTATFVSGESTLTEDDITWSISGAYITVTAKEKVGKAVFELTALDDTTFKQKITVNIEA